MSTPTTPSPDFPSWFPSALVKELRQGLRTLSFILLLSLFPAALALFFLFSFIPDPTGDGTLISSGVCNSIFWTFLIFVVAGAIPFRALFSIREELESRNSELLLLTRQTSGRIIMGKWASFMAQALLIMFICLPFAFIRYYYGQINLVQDLTAISFIYLACGILTAFCLWASALPLLLRLATMGALFLICSTSLSLFSSGLEINLFKDGFGMGLLRTAVILTDIFLVIRTLLILAQRWFAPIAENTFAPLRKALLPVYISTIVFMLFILDSPSVVKSLVTVHLIFLWFYSIFLIVIELTTPSTLLPIHVQQTNEKQTGWFQRLFFLPGMPGGFFFSILTAFLIGISGYLFHLMEHSTSSGNGIQSILFMICLTIFGWYAVVMPALVLKPAWKRLKNNTLLVYILFWSISSFFLVLLISMEGYLPLLPGSTFFALLSKEEIATFDTSGFFIFFALLEVMAAFLMMGLSNGEWFATLKKSLNSRQGGEKQEDGAEQP